MKLATRTYAVALTGYAVAGVSGYAWTILEEEAGFYRPVRRGGTFQAGAAPDAMEERALAEAAAHVAKHCPREASVRFRIGADLSDRLRFADAADALAALRALAAHGYGLEPEPLEAAEPLPMRPGRLLELCLEDDLRNRTFEEIEPEFEKARNDLLRARSKGG